MEVPPEE
jgi:hypothetical protein